MASPRLQPSRRVTEILLAAGLAGLKQHRVAALSARHRRLRLALDPLLMPIVGTIGDLVAVSEREGQAGRLLLQWAIEQLRPDRRSGLDGVDEHAWLHSTSWRPWLALSCHHGLLSIPEFPARYRRRPEESPIDNLCGIWSVGPSTVYRYLDKGRRQLVELFDRLPLRGEQLLSLRRTAHDGLRRQQACTFEWEAWHQARGAAALLDGAVADALWHLSRSSHLGALLDALHRYGTEAAGSPETDALLAEIETRHQLPIDQRIDLCLRRGFLWHCSHDVERENDVLSHAVRLAEQHGEPSLLGLAQGALGRFFEERDRDRAIACYEESIGYLKQVVGNRDHPQHRRCANEYAGCVVHLAWLHLRRNNPKAKALLDQFALLDLNAPLEDETIGALEQTWGEYWRCVGNPRQALERKHRALAIFERIGDQRSTLSTYNNLSLIYSDLKEYELAIQYGEKVAMASTRQAVEPELLSSVHCNLGVAYFSLGRLDQALAQYEASRAIAEQAGLTSLLVVSHYNLAETCYERFKQHGVAADEQAGDRHAASAARLSAEANSPAQAEAARALKREILGTGEGPDRLLPTEHATHFNEMNEIERLRLGLAVPQPAAQQVRTHLAIARAYLSIAAKEREAALALAQRHGLEADFGTEIASLRQTFSRELTREQRLSHAWGQQIDDVLGHERRQSVLTHVLAQGSITKSAYAAVAAVSLATASKHLGLLAERGLLVQTGKGPSTRYRLPDSPRGEEGLPRAPSIARPRPA